jgi:cysteinyl-tRNA synthetase
MFCYTAHYRSPLNFSFEGAASAEHGLLNLRKAVSSLDKSQPNGGNDDDKSYKNNIDNVDKSQPDNRNNNNKSHEINRDNINPERISKALEPFMDALCDDLNMPRAVAALWEGLRDDGLTAAEKRAFAEEADKVLGLDLMKSAGDNLTVISEEIDGHKISLQISGDYSPELKNIILQKAALRKKSRAAKDFKTADMIRDQFAAAGVAVKDLPDGTTECVVGDAGRAGKIS